METTGNTTTYLETGSTDPYYNLAFEEFVLKNRTEGAYLILWQNDNTIVIGRNQNTEAEINRECVEKYRINVVRRTTGGGAVYHDLGNLNYSFITDAGDTEQLSIARFTEPVVKALRSLGLDAEASGRNDIMVCGRKVSGTAQRIYKDRVLHHGTLLFDSDPDMIQKALNVDPEKFRSKSAVSVRSRVGNIRDMLPEDKRGMQIGEFKERILAELAEGGFEKDELAPEEIAAVVKLKEEQYDTWEWNYGRSPRFEIENKRRFDGGTLEVRVAVEREGKIKDIVFFGDFLASVPLDGLAEDLKGCRFERGEVSEVLRKHDIGRCFGTITEEEVTGTIFADF